MIISCLWALGLRRAELTNLRVKDFDPHYDPKNKIGLLIVHGKGRKQRALFIVDKLYHKLVNYLARPVSPTHLNKHCNLKHRPIFPSKNGALLTGDHILKIVHQAAQRAGIKQRITPHVLRHSFATEMYLQRVPLNDIQDVMGYETEAETVLYIHVPEKLKQQVKSIFNVIDRDTFLGVRDYAIYAMMYKLGLRVGEVHQLNLENIDFDDNNKITVLGKGNKRRSLHLDDEMIAILSQWIAVRKYFLNHDITNALFISKKGKRLAIRTMEDNFKNILKKLNINFHFNVTCHTLRHSFASHLNDEDVDVLVIQDLLCHATPRTTKNYYIHPSEQRVREALEKLPGVIYMNKLIESGLIRFQSRYHKRE